MGERARVIFAHGFAPTMRQISLRYAEPMAIVLLASDLASLRKELRATLEGPDLIIEEVASGPEVIARVERGGVDLLLLYLQVGPVVGLAIRRQRRGQRLN